MIARPKLSPLLLLPSIVILLLSACESDNRTVAAVVAGNQSFNYQQHIQPIIENKCIACHACNDAPCQLKMQSAEGLERGASKLQVYDGARLKDIPPTRLYMDAQSTDEWHQKGFYSVLEKQLQPEEQGFGPSLLKNYIDLAQQNPLPLNKPIPDSIDLGLKRKNFCPAPAEFADYADENPHGGMPLAVSGLDEKEISTINTWLNEGAKVTAKKIEISLRDADLIQQWESWLNSRDARTKLVARYLYEHLFLGHLYFDAAANSENNSDTPIQFYELVRSYTPSALPVQAVNTVRPFDDPRRPFFYRLRPIKETIVHKTHITYLFDEQRLQRYKELFLGPDWTVKTLPGYTLKERANPFITFAALPASIRYEFLLENAEYFVRNFIRGPVCRGQIATNVIRDQFWVMFEDPKKELYTNDRAYQDEVDPYLGLPGEESSLIELGSEWLKYRSRRNKYFEIRQKKYRQSYPAGPTLAQVWDGNGQNDNAFLTVFRHHDSASVSKGWVGDYPLTTWLMDYPLLERTYYELVASFNVYGSVSHQAQTRLYFDLIRNGAETNYLRLLPADARGDIYQSWYKAAAKIKTEISYDDLDEKSPTAVVFSSDDPHREMLDTLLNSYPDLALKTDEINRCDAACQAGTDTTSIDAVVKQSLSNIAAISAKDLPAILFLPEVTFLRIDLPGGKYLSYSLLRNRRHSSVSFMLGESLRYEKDLDSLTIVARPIGSYPNLMLRVNSTDLQDFVQAFQAANTEKAFELLIDQWAVRRMSPSFWPVLHGFSDWMKEQTPLEAGIYDINRYGRW